MRKIRINGELFEYDPDHKPMAEMLELEKVTDLAYGEWETGLQRGSAQSLAALAWLLWKRDGRGVPFEDIVSGQVELNLGTLTFEGEDKPGPTKPAPEGEGSLSTVPATSGRSAKSA